MVRRLVLAFTVVVTLIIGSTSVSPALASSQVVDLSAQEWRFREVGRSEWLPAKVPGCVQTDLRRNGKIGDPFFRDHENALQWIGERNWEYQTSFVLTEADLRHERVEIHFGGLDTVTEVYLNNYRILQADNFYREWTIDIRSIAHVGPNELLVVFSSPLTLIEQRKRQVPWTSLDDFVFVRKPPYHFGWDWGPVFLTAGIWRPMELRLVDGPRIENVQIITDTLTEDVADLRFIVETSVVKSEQATLTIDIPAANVKKTTEAALSRDKGKVEVKLQIKKPRWWWSRGLGEPNLYQARVAVRTAGQVRDQRTESFGIRTVKVIQRPDEKGSSFYVELNGRPVFCKGANYIPQSMFVSEVGEKDYRNVIQQALAANMNMLRVWGGGIYENDVFYDLCDQSGILVWQEFMFACSMYPGDKAFLSNVRQELIDNVVRLRNHPSIVLWCGNNENYIGWKDWKWPEKMGIAYKDQIWEAYEKLFHKLMPEVLAQIDPTRFYWPSSSKQGWGYPVNTEGDVHYWGVWHAQEPFESYVVPEHVGRFMSEYGFQSLPELSSIERFTWPEDREVYSPVMKTHQKHRVGYPVIDKYLKWYFRQPKDFQAYSYVSQVMQAYGVGMAISAHRRAMPFCMGTLYWQLNDLYPVTSWSSIDVYGNWKALHYRARDLYEPLIVSPVITDGRVQVFAVSDLRETTTGELHIDLMDFHGKVVGGTTISVQIGGNTSTKCFDEPLGAVLQDRAKEGHVLRVRLTNGSKVRASSLLYFVHPKDLLLETPHITTRVEKSGHQWQVILSTDTLAKNVFLNIPGFAAHFSDNYFDLLPGESKSVVISGLSPRAETQTPSVRVYSLTDSY